MIVWRVGEKMSLVPVFAAIATLSGSRTIHGLERGRITPVARANRPTGHSDRVQFPLGLVARDAFLSGERTCGGPVCRRAILADATGFATHVFLECPTVVAVFAVIRFGSRVAVQSRLPVRTLAHIHTALVFNFVPVVAFCAALLRKITHRPMVLRSMQTRTRWVAERRRLLGLVLGGVPQCYVRQIESILAVLASLLAVLQTGKRAESGAGRSVIAETLVGLTRAGLPIKLKTMIARLTGRSRRHALWRATSRGFAIRANALRQTIGSIHQLYALRETEIVSRVRKKGHQNGRGRVDFLGGETDIAFHTHDR